MFWQCLQIVLICFCVIYAQGRNSEPLVEVKYTSLGDMVARYCEVYKCDVDLPPSAMAYPIVAPLYSTESKTYLEAQLRTFAFERNYSCGVYATKITCVAKKETLPLIDSTDYKWILARVQNDEKHLFEQIVKHNQNLGSWQNLTFEYEKIYRYKVKMCDVMKDTLSALPDWNTQITANGIKGALNNLFRDKFSKNCYTLENTASIFDFENGKEEYISNGSTVDNNGIIRNTTEKVLTGVKLNVNKDTVLLDYFNDKRIKFNTLFDNDIADFYTTYTKDFLDCILWLFCSSKKEDYYFYINISRELIK